MTALIGVLFCASLLHLLLNLYGGYHLRGLFELSPHQGTPPERWPAVTVVIPACNEALHIEAAMQSLLDLDYPDLQILAINDRSTDDTGRILERLAEHARHLEVIHIEALPEGWLGKLHAMHVGAQAARGDYVVYADADVVFSRDALRDAVALAEDEGLDMLALVPKLVTATTLLTAVIGLFGMLFMASVRPRALNADQPGVYGGVGAFNMVRRSLFEETEGWPWLRLEIADDLGLAYLMHRHGAKARLGLASAQLQLCWYESTASMVAGLRKNLYSAVARFHPGRALMLIIGLTLASVSPFALLATPWAPTGVFFILALSATGYLGPLPSARRPSFALSPFCGPIMVWALCGSMVHIVRQGSVRWRGTSYPVEELKRHQRVML
jgi:GT2 family glycosyltransferase